ncbi:hypothetical protein NC652_004121 [Populus alba x Populus x berolinensis]|uniref:Uncharacterized protein n=1 Tax=Populus tomentosa TaxID=118781 RepID=A0A8X8IYJ3_POPTO|nr:hypothetical protein POTOM_003071 [Populus tomentosa]KAJ6966464.1 hypothetical protein NC652_004121 [Populus alba x Populus x berolinensis]
MKPFYLSCFILALLLLTSSAEMMEVMRDNNGRCAAVMDPDGCNLSSCRQRCLQQKNGNGVCLANLKAGSYQCVCYVNC